MKLPKQQQRMCQNGTTKVAKTATDDVPKQHIQSCENSNKRNTERMNAIQQTKSRRTLEANIPVWNIPVRNKRSCENSNSGCVKTAQPKLPKQQQTMCQNSTSKVAKTATRKCAKIARARGAQAAKGEHGTQRTNVSEDCQLARGNVLARPKDGSRARWAAMRKRNGPRHLFARHRYTRTNLKQQAQPKQAHR